MTLLYVVVSIIPIIQVESRFIFALKIGGLIVITNLLGLAILFAIGKRRANTQLVSERLP
jgi:cell shape-determining protein MreD